MGGLVFTCPRIRRGDIDLETTAMLDLVVLAIGLGFFALTILYGSACDRL
jgi:hypothetical protein